MNFRFAMVFDLSFLPNSRHSKRLFDAMWDQTVWNDDLTDAQRALWMTFCARVQVVNSRANRQFIQSIWTDAAGFVALFSEDADRATEIGYYDQVRFGVIERSI